MISILFLEKNGVLYGVESLGHASQKGFSVPCMGVSLVLRTFLRTLLEMNIPLFYNVPREGEFYLKIDNDAYETPLVLGASLFLQRALFDLEEEFTKDIKIFRR